MRFRIILFSACFVLIGCGGGGSSSTNSPGGKGSNEPSTSEPARVLSVYPEDQSVGNTTLSTIEVVFDKAVNIESISASTIKLEKVGYLSSPSKCWRDIEKDLGIPAKVEYIESQNSIEITPNMPLSYNGRYRVDIVGLRDADGGVVNFSSEFGTKDRDIVNTYYHYPQADVIFYTISEFGDRGEITLVISYVSTSEEGEPFSQDNPVNSYGTLEYYGNGQLWRNKVYMGAGVDNVWFTSDDELTSYQEYKYESNNLLSSAHKYKDAGSDGEWFTSDDVIEKHITCIYDANDQVVLYREGLRAPSIGKEDSIATIDRYELLASGSVLHSSLSNSAYFDDAKGEMVIRPLSGYVLEYLTISDTDEWLSASRFGFDHGETPYRPEDFKSFDTLVYEYNQSGAPIYMVSKKSTHIGEDSVWGTNDDSYTVSMKRTLSNSFSRSFVREEHYDSSEELSTYILFDLNEDGEVVRETHYSGKGLDNTWNTSDDEVSRIIEYRLR